MRKAILWIMSLVALSLSASGAWGYQIPDRTLVLEFLGHTSGAPPTQLGGWVDVIGGAEFDTKGADLGAPGHLIIFSNWGPTLDNLNFKTADFFIDLNCNKNGVFDYAVRLDANTGSGIVNGKNIFVNPITYQTATDLFSKLNTSFGGLYDLTNSANPTLPPDPATTDPVPVVATSTATGTANVVWTPLTQVNPDDPAFMVDIDLSGIIAPGTPFCFVWGTATCANDVFADQVPAVPLPPSALLLGSSLLGLAGCRRFRKGYPAIPYH